MFDEWIVLDKSPSRPTQASLIVLDDEAGEFGLCAKARAGLPPTLVGLNGSFATTLEAM